tara:strand:- start:77 stop:310 length:234 start_codon:yes stop_codon:yes gene_type:complete
VSAFGEWMCSDTPSQEANLIAKAVNLVTKKGKVLSQVCSEYSICERDVVSFIVEQTEYETYNTVIEQLSNKKHEELF